MDAIKFLKMEHNMFKRRFAKISKSSTAIIFFILKSYGFALLQ